MSGWREDPWFKYAMAACLGMIAGVAAKQAVAIQTGNFPKPILILADFLVLGFVWIIAMYAHQRMPELSLEAIALLAAALAMWGPKGIQALLHKFQTGALRATGQVVETYVPSIEPVHRPTDPKGLERDQMLKASDEDLYGKTAPIRALRDIVPLESDIPADWAGKLGQVDSQDEQHKGDTHE